MILQWLRQFMAGRYGVDRLYYVLLVTSIVFMMFARWTGFLPVGALGWAALFLCTFRALSRNTYRRFEENRRFLAWWAGIRRTLAGLGSSARSLRTHRHLRCPKCRQKIRVPRSRGKICITCPKCRDEFIRKT